MRVKVVGNERKAVLRREDKEKQLKIGEICCKVDRALWRTFQVSKWRTDFVPCKILYMLFAYVIYACLFMSVVDGYGRVFARTVEIWRRTTATC